MKRRSKRVWNNYEIADEKDFGEPLRLEYGSWPWGQMTEQRFTKESAEKIARDLASMIESGEPGIPVYQGHPDVPELASRYPDKGALGWIKRIDVEDDGCWLQVEWDRFPGKGFGWMSPYWGGEQTMKKEGGLLVEISELYSLGLVNNPNIRDFRLPNEEAEQTRNNKGVKMTLEELLKLLGFAEGATPEEIKSKCEELMNALEARKADEAKTKAACEEAAKAANEAKAELEQARKELDETKSELANCKAEAEKSKAELANSKAEVEKLMSLKSVSVTMKLQNEAKATEDRMALVNEIMAKKQMNFDSAWAEAKATKPDLFK